MAQIQYISLKVTGRPDENGGYNPLILFNNPAFEIKDQDYVGFENNSFFYSIKDCDKYTVFKLVKNNVRAYNGFRLSTIKIAFSIPKGYHLDNNITPYDVLNTLKDDFLSACLRCVDTQKETYEYTSNRIDANVLDETVKKFSISQGTIPNLKMNPQSPIGYIVKSDREIEQLFRDFYYMEFGDYSEIIIAESVNQTNYKLINNIQIPRPKSYSVFVDGKLHASYTNLNESIEVESTESSDFYENKKVSFTIQNLLDNDLIPASGIEFYKEAEKVMVSTKGWAKPKVRKIKLHIVPKDYENYILTHSNLISITWPFGEIKLDQDFSFTLIGEQIAEIERNSIKFSLKSNDRYEQINYDIYGDELRVTVSEIRSSVVQRTGGAGQHRYQQQEKVTDLQVVKPSPVYDVTILLGDKEIFEESNEIDVKLKTIDPQGTNLRLATCRTTFTRTSNGVFEGHFYVPKEFSHQNLYLYFRANDKNYVTKQPQLLFSNEKAVVRETDFDISNVAPLPFYKKRSFKMLIPFIAILLGFIIGFASHDGIKSLLDGTKQSPNTATTNTSDREVAPSMTEDQAYDFLKDADGVLKNKDLEFSKVDELYHKYIKFKNVIENVDKKRLDDTVCDRIEDYNKVISYIRNCDIEMLRKALEDFDNNDLHIWPQHADLIKQILKDNSTIEQFRNNYSEITGFAIIGDVIATTEDTSGNTATTYKCDRCGKAFDTESEKMQHSSSHITTFSCDKCNMTFPSRKELKTHKDKKHHFACPVCGPNVWYETEKELGNHSDHKHKNQTNEER